MTTSTTSGIRIAGAVPDDTTTRRTATATSPIDGSAVGEVALGTRDDALRAFAIADSFFTPWSETTATERAAALRQIAQALRSEADSVEPTSWPWLLSTETGKRLAEAQAEIRFSAVYFEVFADLIEEQHEEHFDVIPGIAHTVRPEPLGVVAVLTPWNFPVSIPARKIAAALAAGCTVVFRPAELAVLSSLRLAELLDRFLPAGAVNTVVGAPDDVVDPWLERVHCVSFTGSTRVGRIINERIAARFLPAVMELGGNASFIVLDDADVDEAVNTLLVAKLRNNGQSCIAANNVLVPRALAGDFRDALRSAIANITLGDPRDATTDLGPLAPPADPGRVSALVEQARAEGGEVLSSASAESAAGHYAPLQFVFGASASVPLVAEEVFGPAAGVVLYDDLEGAIATQRASGYGLASYVATADPDRGHALARRFRAGIIGINTATPNYPGAPFGGVGLSGLGYEGGRQGLEAHQHFRTIATMKETR